MSRERTAIERAYDLASSGACNDIRDIGARLKAERYESVDAHLTGSVAKSLRKLIKEAKAKRLADLPVEARGETE